MRLRPQAGHVATDIPWHDLPRNTGTGCSRARATGWYGVRRYFDWLESKSYKMHMRVLLSKYRSYDLCETCHGARLKPEALAWRVGTTRTRTPCWSPGTALPPPQAAA
jgi:excinuclease ABC subunit A